MEKNKRPNRVFQPKPTEKIPRGAELAEQINAKNF
jgi:hypothetical protein